MPVIHNFDSCSRSGRTGSQAPTADWAARPTVAARQRGRSDVLSARTTGRDVRAGAIRIGGSMRCTSGSGSSGANHIALWARELAEQPQASGKVHAPASIASAPVLPVKLLWLRDRG